MIYSQQCSLQEFLKGLYFPNNIFIAKSRSHIKLKMIRMKPFIEMIRVLVVFFWCLELHTFYEIVFLDDDSDIQS